MSSNGKAPQIRPHNIEIHSQTGLRWMSYKVTMPADSTLQDLQDHPDMFAGFKFRQDDELRIFAHDRSWCVDCTVITADPGRVVLSKPRVIWSGQDARVGIEWQDEHHEVEWTGRAYGIFRKGVGNRPRVQVSDGFQTLGSAKTAVSKQYSRAV